jgi:hypothetical protein
VNLVDRSVSVLLSCAVHADTVFLGGAVLAAS